MFDRLGVFAGSFDAERRRRGRRPATASRPGTCSTRSPSLVAKSMVVADERRRRRTRYQLLETLRAYARERLDEAGEADAWRRRHAEHYARSPRRPAPRWSAPTSSRGGPRHQELDNLRAP